MISVAMLSEGWDAKNVTHIMGLRAFTSQLLCEQVIGRGLRRVSYDTDEDGLFLPEYVNVFGVPLSIFQDVGEGGEAPPPPKPSIADRSHSRTAMHFEIRWPNVLRVDSVVKPQLVLDWDQVGAADARPGADADQRRTGPAFGGATDMSKVHEIDLEKLPEEFRLQRLIFQAARKAFEDIHGRFKGNRDYLVSQLIRLVEQFFESDRVVHPVPVSPGSARKRILFALNIDMVVQHLLQSISEQNLEHLEPVFDEDMPIGSTRYMRTWYTTKHCMPTPQVTDQSCRGGWKLGAIYRGCAGKERACRCIRQERSSGIPGVLPVEGQQETFYSGLSDQAFERQDTGTGDQGPGFATEPGKTCGAGFMGEGCQCQGWVWCLVLGCGVPACADSGYFSEA